MHLDDTARKALTQARYRAPVSPPPRPPSRLTWSASYPSPSRRSRTRRTPPPA